VISESHAVLAVKAVRATLRAVLRESAAPSPDGCAAACHLLGRAIPPAQKDEDSLMNTSTISLIAHFADGSERPATGEEIIAVARDYMSRRVRRGTQLGSPKATREFLSLKLGTLEREVFAVIFLDKRHRLISYQEMFQGTIDGASVHPREVVKEALKQNAAAVILAHPHPSGVAEPSQADELITRRLKDALDLVDIRVLDHIIIAGGEATSFAERGLL
jgi:DNA repair protein RadC